MSNYNYAEKFGNKVVGESFNIAIEHAAQNGQIAQTLQDAALLEGIIVAAKPAKFIQELNSDFLQAETSAPDAKTIKIIQALHTLALALKDSGQVKNLPEINGLPLWACPVAIAAKAAATKAKAAATRAAKKAADEAAAKKAAADEAKKAKTKASLMTAPTVAADFEALIIAIRNSDFSSLELSQLQNALDFAKSKAQAPAKV